MSDQRSPTHPNPDPQRLYAAMGRTPEPSSPRWPGEHMRTFSDASGRFA